MEMMMLGMMIAAEVALAIATGVKKFGKKQWLTVRLSVNVGEVALFLLATILPQIDFGFRFTAFLALLLIRALIAGIAFLAARRKAEGKKKMFPVITGVIVSTLLMTCSLIPAFLITDYEGLATTGSHEVAMEQAILVDANRLETFESDGSNREVPVHFYYPADADGSETYPLVLFSHGAFGYYQSNTSTYMELASHGYVVVSLDHPYHSFFTEDTDGKMIIVNTDFMNEVMYINEENTPEEEIDSLFKKWLAIRDGDVNFALDSIEAAVADGTLNDAWFLGETEENAILRVLKCINCDKIGVMGHSLGGASAVDIGRNRDDVDAVIDLDGTMGGEQLGFSDETYVFEGKTYPLPIFNEEPYPVALLSFDNQEHHDSSLTLGDYYVNNIVMNNGVDTYRTYIAGSGHMNYTDLPLLSPVLASNLGTGPVDSKQCVLTMNEIILQFMDCYLKQEGTFTVQEGYEVQ